jgi:NDP-sugar pyrophosphorylase family protein
VVYAGVHITHPDFIAREPEMAFGLMVPWSAAMEQGRLHGWMYAGRWTEMGTHSGLQAARALVSAAGG